MKTSILMVCLGNICRSPLAEGILQSKLNSDAYFIDSAGTGGYHIGNPPDSRSIAVAKKYGIDISKQKCRQFTTQDFLLFDIIYVMDQSNYNTIIKLAKDEDQKSKVKFLLAENHNENKQVTDPYYDDNGFEHVFKLIDDACNALVKKLSDKNTNL